MNEEKCFCHLGEYAVKDATARADIEHIKKDIEEIEEKHILENNELIAKTSEVEGKVLALETIKEDVEQLKQKTALDDVNNLYVNVKGGALSQPNNKISLTDVSVKLRHKSDDGTVTNVIEDPIEIQSLELPIIPGDNVEFTFSGKNIKINATGGGSNYSAGAGIELVEEDDGTVSINNSDAWTEINVTIPPSGEIFLEDLGIQESTHCFAEGYYFMNGPLTEQYIGSTIVNGFHLQQMGISFILTGIQAVDALRFADGDMVFTNDGENDVIITGIVKIHKVFGE